MNTFDQLSKGLANGGLSRRDGLKLAFGGAAFAALSALGLGSAAAAAPNSSFESLCNNVPGTCGNFHNCGTNSNCFCFEHINRGGETYCGCDVLCYSATSCTANNQCPAQTLCADSNGCTGCAPGVGICIHKCKGQFQNCQLGLVGQGASARTAALN